MFGDKLSYSKLSSGVIGYDGIFMAHVRTKRFNFPLKNNGFSYAKITTYASALFGIANSMLDS